MLFRSVDEIGLAGVQKAGYQIYRNISHCNVSFLSGKMRGMEARATEGLSFVTGHHAWLTARLRSALKFFWLFSFKKRAHRPNSSASLSSFSSAPMTHSRPV